MKTLKKFILATLCAGAIGYLMYENSMNMDRSRYMGEETVPIPRVMSGYFKKNIEKNMDIMIEMYRTKNGNRICDVYLLRKNGQQYIDVKNDMGTYSADDEVMHLGALADTDNDNRVDWKIGPTSITGNALEKVITKQVNNMLSEEKYRNKN